MVAVFRKKKYFNEIYMLFKNWDEAATYCYECFDERNYHLFTIGQVSLLRVIWYYILSTKKK